jgi:dihydrodipicolinate synthase/N-acetylneuraminate lyase
MGLMAGAAALNAPVAGLAGPGSPSRPDMDRLRERIQGVHCFMVTPFHPDGSLNAEGLRRNIARHADAGVQDMTIVVGGGMGEIFSLDLQEHRAMAEAAARGAQGKLPVVVGACGGYRMAGIMARTAQEAGADAILLFAPPYWNWIPGYDEGTIRYFTEVARSIDIGVVLATVSGHNFPTGKEKYWPKVLRRLSELPNVLGFEDSSGDIAMGQELGTLVSDRLVWIARGEGHAVKALPAGARGNTSAVATFVPQACREFCRLGRLGEVDSMQEVLRTRIQPIARVRSLSPGYHVSGIKVALEALGRAGGPVRPPGRAVLPEDRPRIAAIAREHAED